MPTMMCNPCHSQARDAVDPCRPQAYNAVVLPEHGSIDIDAESANNEEQFATQFYNFMGRHLDFIISQVLIPQINLDIGTAPPQAVLALSSADSTPDQQKYHVDDINKPPPCTLLYVKGRMLRTIKVTDAIAMTTRIMHG
jgi:hypothetical protein